MSNRVIRIGRKGLMQFAFGEEGEKGSEPITVDVVVAFEEWLVIDDNFRSEIEPDSEGNRNLNRSDMPAFHNAMVMHVEKLRGNFPFKEGVELLTTAEALDFMARLREEYDRLAVFFRPKSMDVQESPDTSKAASVVQFSEEPTQS